MMLVGMVLVLLLLAAVPLLNVKPIDKAWSILQQAAADKSADTRARAVHALGLVNGNSRARGLAENALTDSDADVRVEAAKALGEMHAASSKTKLRLALNDKEVKVVVAAANSLYIFKDPAAYQVYYAMLTGVRKSGEGLLQSQLDTLHDRKAMEKLIFETGIGFVPFGGMGWDAWKTISRDDSVTVQAAAAEKLATDPDPKSSKALVQCSSDKRWQVRAAVASAISKRGDPKLSDVLIPLMLDDNETVRCQAAAAFVHLDGREAHRGKKQHS